VVRSSHDEGLGRINFKSFLLIIQWQKEEEEEEEEERHKK
jgi:hypothetical protein